MLNNLNDDQILEYLMTSDYHEEFKNSELKFLLTKFKYFYRLLHGRYTNLKGDSEFKLNNLTKDLENSGKQIYDLQVQNAELKNEIDLNKNKNVIKLTFWERWKGVVDLNKKGRI